MKWTRLSATLTIVAALGAAAATPARADAQDLLKRMRAEAVKRVEQRKAKMDSAVIRTATGAVDSTLEKTGRGAQAVVGKVGSLADTTITRTERGVRSVTARDDGAAELAARLATGHAVVRELQFAAGSDQLDESAAAQVKRLAKALAATPGTFLIEGHTESMDSPDAARALSERRAAAVKAHLVAEGVAAARLLAVGHGAARPTGDDEKGGARIELTRAQ